jgi:hypothetical protein
MHLCSDELVILSMLFPYLGLLLFKVRRWLGLL